MHKRRRWGAIGLTALALSGCMTAAPVKVTRFHLGAPIERVAITVEPDAAAVNVAGLEAGLYADAVRSALAAQGFVAADAGTPAPLVARFTLTRTVRETEPARAPVTIGLGGGSFGGGVGGGVGGGASVGFGVGKTRAREAYVSELRVAIRRGAAGDVIWEGRAQHQADTRSPDAQPPVVARKLADALFRGFPGESGRSITVP
ncbi:MAG: hypothetical protein DI607_11015 [Sphingomonas hengshuiensis]|nr:hypothetical protein [Sphingobium sp.]PZP11200.1 MAG: hypothetical protein DI607_11015 [Sphingomonas hengshuiensis]